MKKYILIIIVGISVLLGAILLQAAAGVYSPRRVAVRVRDSKLDVSWEHHPNNPYPVDNYRVYYGTQSGGPYSSQDVNGLYRWATLSGLTNGDTCYIKVGTIDEGGGSDTSADHEWVATPAPADTTVSRSISGGTTASAYTMVSTPVELEDTRMSAVLGNDLGPYDNTQWRCFHWESDFQVYEEGTSSNDTGPDEGAPLVGEAIWLISRNDATIHSTGCKYDHYYPQGTHEYYIHLESGWNQIGCPYNMRIAWANQNVEVNNPFDPCMWRGIAHAENVWTCHNLWGWYSAAYHSMINLVPTHGFFLYSYYDTTLRVIRPVSGASPPDRDYRPVRGEDYDPDIKAPPYERGGGGGPPPPPPAFVSADLSSGGGGGCFIATAAYGTEMAKEVMLLQKFRDEVLLKSPAGREFVKLYYTFSPPIADFIKDKPTLKTIVRINLKPLIWLSRKVTK